MGRPYTCGLALLTLLAFGALVFPATAQSKNSDSPIRTWSATLALLSSTSLHGVYHAIAEKGGPRGGTTAGPNPMLPTAPGEYCPSTVSYAGKIYHGVAIGSQCWLQENLDVGQAIPSSDPQSNDGVIEKHCYDDQPTNCDVYGGLYTWDEAMQDGIAQESQGICPSGWHIPSLREWQELASVVNNDYRALEAVGQGDGRNNSRFSALLGGFLYPAGIFGYKGSMAYFWSSTGNGAQHAYAFFVTNLNSLHDFIGSENDPTRYGYSIRCIEDQQTNSGEPPMQ